MKKILIFLNNNLDLVVIILLILALWIYACLDLDASSVDPGQETDPYKDGTYQKYGSNLENSCVVDYYCGGYLPQINANDVALNTEMINGTTYVVETGFPACTIPVELKDTYHRGDSIMLQIDKEQDVNMVCTVIDYSVNDNDKINIVNTSEPFYGNDVWILGEIK